MMQTFEKQQPSLFELIEEAPRIALPPVQKTQLAALIVSREVVELGGSVAAREAPSTGHRSRDWRRRRPAGRSAPPFPAAVPRGPSGGREWPG